MVKKALEFILKILWIIFILLTPTIILSIYYIMYSKAPKSVLAIYFYGIPIIFIVLVVCINLFIWKKLYSLFALPLGFFLSPVFIPTVLSILGIRQIINNWFGGESSSIIILTFAYAFPFAVIAITVAILIRNKNIEKKIK